MRAANHLSRIFRSLRPLNTADVDSDKVSDTANSTTLTPICSGKEIACLCKRRVCSLTLRSEELKSHTEIAHGGTA
eukprot:2851658-Rhodomonas_salina.1